MGHLDINGLTKIFGEPEEGIMAVDDLDFTIKDGEFLVLVGPSGCGKSTTLRCIGGLERPTEGNIILDGQSIVEKKPKNRGMAMVFQNYALYPHMTSRENMSFGVKMTTDIPKPEIEKRVNDTAGMLGITELLEQKPSELSGGQQQRVALGRAIVRDPEVFLMDEPLSNLDAKLRTQMRTELQNLQQDLDVTTIYVTHDQTEAMTMGDRIAVLNKGKLQQIGTPLECYNQPENAFVAGFIGSPSMNFYDVKFNTSKPAFEHGAFEYEISQELRDSLQEEGEGFILGIRPEDIRATNEDELNRIDVEVNVVEPLGDSKYIYFDIGDTHTTTRIRGDIDVKPSDKIGVVFPEDKIHVFNSENGISIKNSELKIRDEITV
jgi:multiple sugar transport system ATP-binding protein